jgi:hypothetical protein
MSEIEGYLTRPCLIARYGVLGSWQSLFHFIFAALTVTVWRSLKASFTASTILS